MAESIAFDIATNILTELGSYAFGEISLAYGVENDRRKLMDTMSTIKAVLADADQKRDQSQLVQVWIKKLNDVLYDADNVMDAFSTKALLRERDGRVLKTRVREFFSSSNPIAFRSKMGHRIKEIRERMDDIAADMSKLNFVPIVEPRVDNRRRDTHSFVLMSEVIGRDQDKEEIVKLLKSSSTEKENVVVIGIVGIGGLGKTTLAQFVYGDERIVNDFDLKMWVCVSEDFETKSLVKKMLNDVGTSELDQLQKQLRKKMLNDVGASELDQLQEQLRKKLDGKRYLLILDDVWNENYDKWVGVRNLLMGGAKGSVIVVTTRSRRVASVMGVQQPYILEGLSKEQSWSLFEKVAFQGHEKVHSKLKEIGQEIIERCKGVPLAVRSLASVMQSRTEESEWLSIRNSDIWSLCEDEGDILPILKLSYDHLPSYLKQCFAYCSIFQKDHRIEKGLLIQLWMAQGYLQSPSGSQHLEDIGTQYFRDLFSRSFFQEEVEVDDYNEVRYCKMHDLIHDLAVRVAGSDCLSDELDAENISEKIHHVSFGYSFMKFPEVSKARGLRTLLFVSSPIHEIDINVFISNFRYLRVLDLSDYGVKEVPSSIGKLQHLRFLDLSRNNEITSLPNSIGNLINLQTLKLLECDDLKKLPRSITKLIRLRYLEFERYDEIDHMPSGMGKLTSLRRLSIFVVGRDKGSLQLRELNGLNELKGEISIKGLENVRDAESESKGANLMAKQYLRSLTLEWGTEEGSTLNTDDREKMLVLLEGLEPHPELRELTIWGYSGRMLPSWMMRMGNNILPNLVSIDLISCKECRHLPPLLDQLPFLKSLQLISLDRMEHIDDDNVNLAKRKSSSSSSLFFPSLEKLVIINLPNLKGWWKKEEEEEEEEESSLLGWSHRPSFPRLTHLRISYCHKLTSIMPMYPHLEKLEVHCVSEKVLRQVLTAATTKTKTKKRKEGSGSTTTTTSISSCSTKLPSSSSSSSPLSKLRSLTIGSIDDIEYLSEELLQNLTSLEDLFIVNCPRLSHVAAVSEEEEGSRCLSSLVSLFIYGSRCLTSLSLQTQHLTSLQKLRVDNCENFDFCDDGLHWQGLRSLRVLHIEEIPKLVSLPVGLQSVTTLQQLQIGNCPGVMALPEWISNLNSLQMLRIVNCPSLTERCRKETGEDWPKISHVPNIEID